VEDDWKFVAQQRGSLRQARSTQKAMLLDGMDAKLRSQQGDIPRAIPFEEAGDEPSDPGLLKEIAVEEGHFDWFEERERWRSKRDRHSPAIESKPRKEFPLAFRRTRARIPRSSSMKTESTKKKWVKPALRDVPIFFECASYAGAR